MKGSRIAGERRVQSLFRKKTPREEDQPNILVASYDMQCITLEEFVAAFYRQGGFIHVPFKNKNLNTT